MTANDSQIPGRIPAPAIRPRSGAENSVRARRYREFTSSCAGRVDELARETLAPSGTKPAGAAAIPLARETGRAAGPFAALSLRSERLLRAGRSAAWPMPFRPGIPPRLRSVPRAPTCPRPKRAFPPASHAACNPTGPAPAGRGLTPYKASSNRRR